ncbi:MAG: oxidoreductase [Verrucomicrobia bacterium]|nr:oxidoreductase [Verrucomicrobiota bacterium]
MTFPRTGALLILMPLAAAALAFAWPGHGRALARISAAAMTAALAALTREIMAHGVQMHRVGGWGAPLGIELRADGLGVFMLIIAALIGVAVTLYSPSYFASRQPESAPAKHNDSRQNTPSRQAAPPTAKSRDEDGQPHRTRYFWPLFLFLWTALNALFLSADIFNLYVALELLGFGAVTLVALAGGHEALTAAMRYLWVSLAASLFYLLGVALVYGRCATVDLPSLASKAQPGPALWVALALMTGGLAAKAALFPMHFWLPPAHANAPAPVSALLSALVVKGPVYILLRLWFEAFHGLITPAATHALGALGAAAILWGSVRALVQPRLKLLVAYSTVAQLGYVFLLFPLAASPESGLAAWSGGLMFLGAHACAKTAIFLTAGNILHAAGHDRIRDLDGITHALPISAFAFGLAGLSLVGLPPSSGFAGKWMLLSASLAQGQWWWIAVILAGSLLAAAYVLRVLTHAFTRVPNPLTPKPVPPVMEWTALALAVAAVGLGFAAHGAAELLQVGAPNAVASRDNNGPPAKPASAQPQPQTPPEIRRLDSCPESTLPGAARPPHEPSPPDRTAHPGAAQRTPGPKGGHELSEAGVQPRRAAICLARQARRRSAGGWSA